VHPAPTPDKIEQVLQLASELLQDPRNGCGVGFTLKGQLGTFTSAPAVINNAADLEAVHRVPARVKIVQEINFCIGGQQNGLIGCSWRPYDRPKTMIVTTRMMGVGIEPVLFAHEFGHVTGLLHRTDADGEALMTPCRLQAFNRLINKDECRHFVAGPAKHYPPGQGPACSDRGDND
jgi:hypothetical protein